MDDMQTHGKYITWPILTLMAFVTVIGFDDIMYNFQNQGMTVITSWILMLFLYVIPYSLMVGHLGSVFNHEGGGLSSWIRGTKGEFLGYFTAWTYWAASVPYVVDSANSVVVGFGWAFTGSNKFQDTMSNAIRYFRHLHFHSASFKEFNGNLKHDRRRHDVHHDHSFRYSGFLRSGQIGRSHGNAANDVAHDHS